MDVAAARKLNALNLHLAPRQGSYDSEGIRGVDDDRRLRGLNLEPVRKAPPPGRAWRPPNRIPPGLEAPPPPRAWEPPNHIPPGLEAVPPAAFICKTTGQPFVGAGSLAQPASDLLRVKALPGEPSIMWIPSSGSSKEPPSILIENSEFGKLEVSDTEGQLEEEEEEEEEDSEQTHLKPWQAAYLLRCSDLFIDHVIKQSDFEELLTNLLARDEARQQQRPTLLLERILQSESVREDGMVDLHHVAKNHCVSEGRSGSLESNHWDTHLVKRYLSGGSRKLPQKPGPSQSPFVKLLQAEEQSRSALAQTMQDQGSTVSWISVPLPTEREKKPAQGVGLALPVGTAVSLHGIDYVIENSIGRGGFGSVYRAQRKLQADSQQDASTGGARQLGQEAPTEANLAIKVMIGSEATFAVEALAASLPRELSDGFNSAVSRNYCGKVFLPVIHGVGVGSIADETCPKELRQPALLVMELADSTLEDKRFEGQALIMVAWALASTLALLNQVGLLHGDLKPSNVLWKSAGNVEMPFPGLDGWPLLTDFGSAQSANSMRPDSMPLLEDEQIATLGWTKAYAAPEVDASRGKQSIRSDMYSWARTVETISKDKAMMPVDLQGLLYSCLCDDPESRPSSFSAIADALVDEALCEQDHCIQWGQLLWRRQQASVEKRDAVREVKEQSLEVLMSRREENLSLMTRREQADTLVALAKSYQWTNRHRSRSLHLPLLRRAIIACPEKAVSLELLQSFQHHRSDLSAEQRAVVSKRWANIFNSLYNRCRLRCCLVQHNCPEFLTDELPADEETGIPERRLKRFLKRHFGDEVWVNSPLIYLAS